MSDDGSAIKQKLMDAEEVYVYKIPPLKTSGGHRAEDWNLGNPLKTCRLLVERRGDSLYLDFLFDGKVFAQAYTDDAANVKNWVQPVVDSSRYFVVKIAGAGGKQALIGFGFRDREAATDLRESLQHYEKSMHREGQGASLASYSVPKMEKGQKIHVNRGAGKSTISSQSEGGGAGGSVPRLQKKPPPPADTESASAASSGSSSKKQMEKITFAMGDIDLDAARSGEHGGDDSDGGDDSSGGAVYTGSEDQWATEFVMK